MSCLNDVEIMRLFGEMNDEIVKLKRKYEDLEQEFQSFVKTDIVNVSYKYANKAENETQYYSDFTTTVTKGSKVPKAPTHEDGTWELNGKPWDFNTWLANKDITLVEKRTQKG